MYHLDNFGTNLTSATSASDTTSPVDSVPPIATPFWVAFDATNINGHYEVKLITSKTATNILHSALSFDHTTAEEVRIVNPALEFDALSTGWQTGPGTWTYSSADAPTFVFTTSVDLSPFIGVGTRIKLTQTTVKYFIVTAISGTTVTVYGGTDYTLANAAITSPFFSLMKAPIGFPLDPTKWTVKVTDTSARSQASPVQNTWYNLGSITISVPIGGWDVDYQVNGYFDDSTSTVLGDLWFTLSTGNNSETDKEFTAKNYMYVNSSVSGSGGCLYTRSKQLVVASKTSYYLNEKTSQSGIAQIFVPNDSTTCVIRAVCAYL